jgi:hypothetical protein
MNTIWNVNQLATELYLWWKKPFIKQVGLPIYGITYSFLLAKIVSLGKSY